MRHFHRIVAALSLLLPLTPAPPLAAQADGDEYAETPTDLRELLGPADAQRLPSDSFVRLQRDDGVDYESNQYSLTESGLVVTEHTLLLKDQGQGYVAYHRVTRYSQNGDLIRRDEVSQTEHHREVYSIVPHDGGLLSTWSYQPDEPIDETTEDHEELPGLDPTAIPFDWLSIAYSYHLNRRHERFIIRLQDLGDGQVTVFTIQNIGAETIEVDGQERQAHVLMISSTHETNVDGRNAPDHDIELQQYVFEDGALYQSRVESDNTTLEFLHVSPDEFDAQLERLPPKDEPSN